MSLINLSENYKKQANTSSVSIKEQQDNRPFVLVIGEDDDTCTMLKLWLEIWKFRSLETIDSDKAINIAEEVSPNIILLEISSTHSDKFQIINQMQNNAHLKTTPIILISNNIHFNSFTVTYEEVKFEILPINFSCLEKILYQYSKGKFYSEEMKGE